MSEDRRETEETMEEEEQELTVQPGDTYRCRREDGTYCDVEVEKLRINKQAGREEYYIHYAGLTRCQSEWVDKTRLVLSKQEKQDNVEKKTDQKISEDEEATQCPQSEEDEPEQKRVKVDSSVVCENKIKCMLCNAFCEDTVKVECGHSFCHSCIGKTCKNHDPFSCPDCKNITIEKESSTAALSNTSKTSAGTAATLTSAKPVKTVKVQPLVNCPDHDEKLKLFCTHDGALGCVICRDSLKHKGHKFLPVVDALEVYREELSTAVGPLDEVLKEANELAKQQSEKIEQLQNTVAECRQHIMSEFGNLYDFLKERKDKLLEQLHDQSRSLLEEMETNASKMEENKDSLKEALTKANQKVDETDIVSFLEGIKDFVEKCQEQEKTISSSSNTVIESQLCCGNFKGPIQYFTWKQMKAVIGPIPECEQEPIPPKIEEVSESTTDPPVPNDSDGTNMECEPATPTAQVPLMKDEIPESPTYPPVIRDSGTEHAQKPQPPEEKIEIQPAHLPVFKASGTEHAQKPPSPEEQKIKIQPAHLPVFKASGTELAQKPKTTIVNPPARLPVIKALGTKQIWMVGDVFMNKVNYRALTNSVGLNLGFETKNCKIHWLRSIKYGFGLCNGLKKSMKELNMPDIIFLYVGVNLESEETYVSLFKQELEKVEELFPVTQIILSSLLPEPNMWGNVMESRRRVFNFTLDVYAEKPFIQMLTHDDLEQKLSDRYAAGDLSNITAPEIDVFLTNVRYALQKAMCQDINTIILKCAKLPSAEPVTKPKEISADTAGVHSSPTDATPLVTRFKNFLETTVAKTSKPSVEKVVALPSGDLQKEATVKKPDLLSAERKVESAVKVTGNVQQPRPLEKLDTPGTSTNSASNVQQPKPLEKVDTPGTSTNSASNVQHPKPLEKLDTPGTSTNPARPKEIWITGNSYISRASERAEKNRAIGTNLGFNTKQWVVRWIGNVSRWCNVFNNMAEVGRDLETPSIVYLHIGSNDLAAVHKQMIIDEFMWNIRRLNSLYPKTQFIFSTILPRPEWMSSFVEEKRKSFNSVIGLFAKKCGFDLATNPTLEEMLLYRFREGRIGTFLNIFENDVFLKSMKHYIEQAMLKVDKIVLENQEPQKKVLCAGGTLIVVVPGANQTAANEEKEATKEVKTLEQAVTSEKTPVDKTVTSRNTQGDQPVASEKTPGDHPVTSKKTPGDQPVTSEKTSGDQPVTSEKTLGNQNVTSEKTPGDQLVISEKTLTDHPVTSKKTPGDQPVTSEKTLGDQPVTSVYKTQGTSEDPLLDSPLSNNTGMKYIWIVGNSYICRAAQQATRGTYGINLGFKQRKWTVHWIGRAGMQWSALLPELNDALSELGAPSIVFIHLGDNDVEGVSYDTLTNAIEDDLNQITTQFPNTEFVFSTVLPKAQWLTSSLEQIRQDFNNALVRYAEELGFHVATHEDIEEKAIQRFKSGGSAIISESEYDLFVKRLKDILEVITLKLERTQTALCDLQPL